MNRIPTASDYLNDFAGATAAIDALIASNVETLKPTALAIFGGILAEAAAAVAPIAAKALAGIAGGPPGLALTVASLLGDYAAKQLSAHSGAVASLPADQQALVAQLLPQIVTLVQAEQAKLIPPAPAAPVSLPPA